MTITPSPTIVRTIPMVEEEPERPVYKPAVKPRITRRKVNPAGYKKRVNCYAGHALTEENTYITGNKRRCRTCQKQRAKEYRNRQK